MKKRLFLCVLGILNIFVLNASAKNIVIKSTANRGENNIGDYWIGEDFALGFQKLGHFVEIDYRGEYQKEHERKADICLYMRGYTKFYPPFSEGKTLLYVYYPMNFNEQSKNRLSKEVLNLREEMPEDATLDDDWQNYDIIAVASPSFAKKLNENGIPAIFVPQFTNPEKFYPAPSDALKTDILFVGSNWHDRTSLRYALEEGFEVAVYGYNWAGIVPDDMYKASYIDNNKLNQYYASAKIVLNDHRPDMKENGFVNNRIYDATAAGAMVVSDYMKEIEEVYGDSVPMYKNKEELREILSYYLTHEEQRREKASKAREITLKYYTNTDVAKKILEITNDDD